jgi:hypothetical protein
MMTDRIKQYIEANDNASDYADHLADQLEPHSHEDIDYLMSEELDRDEELWDELGVNTKLVLKDYLTVPVPERGLDWTLGLAGISAASTIQFFTENRDDLLIKPIAYREQVMGRFNLTRDELVVAGRREIPTEQVMAFEPLQQEYVDNLAFLATMTNKDLFLTLSDYEAMRTAEQSISYHVANVSRMASYPVDTPQLMEATAGLVSTSAGIRQKELSRKAISGVAIFREATKGLRTLMAWIVERDKKTCAYCPKNAGEIDTYENWIKRGLPGAGICAGGDRCRCQLVEV